ncbi:MAG: hypothetical protein HZB51_28800 [Chloroflexi bacterium]|nr:hypothetical protein [Chloroflexota bacterium]
MWTQIVGGLVVLIVGTYAIQLFFPRGRSNPSRTSARMDVAPALGFFGVLLIALSLTESIRRSVIEAWVVGIAFGVILGIGAWIALGYRIPAPVHAPRKQSALLATFRLVRTFAVPTIAVVIGLYLIVRIFGPTVLVLLANAVGILLIVVAVRIFFGVKKTAID